MNSLGPKSSIEAIYRSEKVKFPLKKKEFLTFISPAIEYDKRQGTFLRLTIYYWELLWKL